MYFTIKSITIVLTIIATIVTGNNVDENESSIFANNSPGSRIKRAAKPKEKITTCVDKNNKRLALFQPATILERKGKRRVTAMFMERPSPTTIRSPTSVQRKDAQKVISIFRKDKPSGKQNGKGKTTIKSHGTIRLDEQGGFNEKTYGRFDNYQLQINGNNVPSPSTVAHVNIQQIMEGYNGTSWNRWLDRGLNASLRRGRTVWIFQQVVKHGEQLKCPQK